MYFRAFALLAAASYATAQSVSGTAYGFATGVTGGGAAAAVTPKDNAELTKLLSDDVARTIILDKNFDFTGTKATGAGCQRTDCNPSNGGQYFLGDLSCGGGETPVASISYDTAGTSPLAVGSNKSILGVGGKGVITGKGLQLKSGASNVIIQGITITNINPGVCWGGDAIDLKGGNDGVWIDHNKINLIGRQFIVSHFEASRLTVSNNEFDGVTPTTSACNGDHYWTMMFIANGDQVTLDRNYFHDLAGRAPKLGADGVSGTFHATNNYFENMKGHAFDTYTGASTLVEGNVFKAVSQPATPAAQKVSTFYTVANGGTACSSALGRACEANSVDSASGKLSGGENAGVLTTLGKSKATLVKPVAASGVAALVLANAGPAKLGAASAAAPAVSAVAASSEAPVAPATTSPAAAAPVAPSPGTVSSSPSILPPVPSVSTVPALEGEGNATIPSVAAPAVPTHACRSRKANDTIAAPATATAAKIYEQCGGNGFTGPTTCEAGTTCRVQNDWYHQCVPSSARARRQVREGRPKFGKGKGTHFRPPFMNPGNRTLTI